jgi:hypothetical protein
MAHKERYEPEHPASKGRQFARGSLAEQTELHSFALGCFSSELLQLATDPSRRPIC